MDRRVRRRSELKPPKGWEDIKEEIMALNERMRAAESHNVESADPKAQLWDVMRTNWERSRPVYEMKYVKKTMSDELYQWILKKGFADGELIERWRKSGYDRLCCMACCSKNTDHGGVCICRVPRRQRDDPNCKCSNCGCSGCCSGDFDSDSEEESESESQEQSNDYSESD